MGSGLSKDGQVDEKPVANVNKTSSTDNVSNNHNNRKSDLHSERQDRASTPKSDGKNPDPVESRRTQRENRREPDWKLGQGIESNEDEVDQKDQQSTDRRLPVIQQQASPPKPPTADYPETYAQRKQREQYTLNQQLLLRQKTIYRNPHEWQDENAEESYTGGFDASKFRKANQGSLNARDTIFTTSKPGVETSYLHDQRELDEMDITPRHNHQNKEMPVYNASEQDLMASLERELL